MPVFLISILFTCIVESTEGAAVGFYCVLVALFLGNDYELIGCEFGAYSGVDGFG
jgi:hypothetical protein